MLGASPQFVSPPLRVVLVLSGGAARGLVHVGVLDALERRGIAPACFVGSSMGGLIGALSAAGCSALEICRLARSFRFPRWFVPGAMLSWDAIFPSAANALRDVQFAELRTPLLLTAVDVEEGLQAILSSGSVLAAVRATCAVPGVLAPVRIDGRWLIDGGVINMLPIDVASLADPDIVVAVHAYSKRARRLPRLGWPLTSALIRLGRVVPNPATAKVSFELLVRAAEIALDQTSTLARAMTGADIQIDVDVGDIGVRDFDRLDDAIRKGRRAAEQALPQLERLVANTPPRQAAGESATDPHVDPVCHMVASAVRARAAACYRGKTYYFCSPTCREAFDREPERYLTSTRMHARFAG